MSDIKDKFDNCEQMVAFCLKKFPETRGNDKSLILKVWDLQGLRMPQKLLPLFYRAHSSETICRVRRNIQSGGQFLPDPKRVAERSLFNMSHREHFKNK